MLTYLTPIGEESISTPVVGGEQCISLLISGHENQMNFMELQGTQKNTKEPQEPKAWVPKSRDYCIQSKISVTSAKEKHRIIEKNSSKEVKNSEKNNKSLAKKGKECLIKSDEKQKNDKTCLKSIEKESRKLIGKVSTNSNKEISIEENPKTNIRLNSRSKQKGTLMPKNSSPGHSHHFSTFFLPRHHY